MSQPRKATRDAPDAPASRATRTALDAELLERPLTARSIIASLLLGMHPPRLSSARLVQWCAVFGVSEGTARVALSRMVERGELRAEQGVYELAGSLGRRQPAQDWALAPEPLVWDGTWQLAMVTAGARSAVERSELRDAGARARMVEVREGCWTRPANLPRSSASADTWSVLDAQCRWWAATPGADPVELTASLFDPAGWTDRGRRLLVRLTDVTAALRAGAGDRVAEGFVAGAAALQHLRRDPLLPADLVDDAAAGAELRAAYRDYVVVFGDVTAAVLRA